MRLREHARSEVARNTMWAMVNEAVGLISATIGVIVLIPALGPTDYGAYASMFAMIGPFAAFAQSGVLLTMLEHMVGVEEDPVDVVGSCVSIALLLAMALAPICIGLGLAFVHALDATMVVLFVGSELILGSLTIALIATAQVERGFDKGVKLRVVTATLRLGLVLSLALAHSLTLHNFIIGNFALTLLVTGGGALVLPRFGITPITPRAIQRRHFRSTFLYAFGISASITQNDGDKFVMEASGHHVDTGVYAAAYRLVGIGMVPLNAFTGSTHWAVLRSLNQEPNQLRKAMRFALVSAVYAVPAAIVLAIASPLAVRILGDEFTNADVVVRWLAPVIVLRGVSVFPMNGLLGLSRNTVRVSILLGNAAFSVLLYLLLIPPYSWRGAIAATLICESTMFVLAWTALVRCQRSADRSQLVTVPDVEHLDAVADAEDISWSFDRER